MTKKIIPDWLFPQYCFCGCGKNVKLAGYLFYRGHFPRTELTKRKISESRKILYASGKISFKGPLNPQYGKKKSPEAKAKLSKFMTEHNPFAGKHHTKETKEFLSRHTREQMTPEARKHLRECGLKQAAEGKVVNGMKGKHHTEEGKKRIREAQRLRFELEGGHEPYYPKLRFDELLGHDVRSSYESRLGKFLVEHKILYTHESSKLSEHKILIQDIDRKRNYYPDFHIIGTNIYVEPKGPVYDYFLNKMKLVYFQHPEITIYFVVEFKDLLIQGFERFGLRDLVSRIYSFDELHILESILKTPNSGLIA